MSRKANNPFGLTNQQIAFANAYHRGGCVSGTQAAKEAGYSAKTAKSQVSRLLTIVAPYLETLQAETATKNEGERQNNLDALKAIRDLDLIEVLANATGGDEIDEDTFSDNFFVPAVKDLRLIPKAVRQCIASVRQTAHGVEVKFYDRLKAIETINRMCGYNEPDKVEHSGNAVTTFVFPPGSRPLTVDEERNNPDYIPGNNIGHETPLSELDED